MAGIFTKIRHAWNAFANEDEVLQTRSINDLGYSQSFQPSRSRMRFSNERSIISSIYTRLSIDVSSTDIRHVRLDDQGRYLDDMRSGLNNCLTLEANIDQAATAFKQDMALTMFDKGTIALVPVETSLNPSITSGYDILNLRVGEIVQWYPKHVKVSVYNEKIGHRQEITIEKRLVAIADNPFYSVMNEPNSTLQRLIRKLNLLDVVDEQSSAGKLDLIIQLPYVVKSEARRQQAQQRREEIEFQLRGSQYGIAYTDGTERITQLNRPAENNLLGQIEKLTALLYSQLGLTTSIMDGTADEATMINYHQRTIKPILTSMIEAMKRSFLTKTARSQNQSIMFFRDPLALAPVSQIAEVADKFTRNEIASSNEIRGVIGWKPSSDPKADKLVNSNMPAPSGQEATPQTVVEEPLTVEEGDSQNGS